jgi:hypothetical protein
MKAENRVARGSLGDDSASHDEHERMLSRYASCRRSSAAATATASS